MDNVELDTFDYKDFKGPKHTFIRLKSFWIYCREVFYII